MSTCKEPTANNFYILTISVLKKAGTIRVAFLECGESKEEC